ncbi:AIM24 family protein [Pannus brasiliensis CCIBt3594]|uniref:AIM24 family protein n=1 Tax=Pannus brasiliensis CCIBt3594 TaxID=1427578 RepID=A0AAW9QV48_9CHRO
MNTPNPSFPFTVVESVTRGGTIFEILEYESLGGSESWRVAEQIYTIDRAGMRLRQLRVRLNRDAVRTEPGALQFLKGRIEMESSTGAGEGWGGLMKGALAAARTGETIFKPLYRGTGELYLEPTFGHYWLRQLNGETLYADQGLFFCCEDSLKIDAHKVESFSARVAGGEGRYQTKVSGTGLVVFKIPVPPREILEMTLDNETLQVDGTFALLRTEGVHFNVEKASTSIVGAITSGEGLLQTFRGTGRVWIAPTQPVYQKMFGSPAGPGSL